MDRRIFALRNGFLLTAVFAALSATAFCQTPPPPPQHQVSQTTTFAYDAVTIKPDPDGHGFFKLSPDSFSMGGMPACFSCLLSLSSIKIVPGYIHLRVS